MDLIFKKFFCGYVPHPNHICKEGKRNFSIQNIIRNIFLSTNARYLSVHFNFIFLPLPNIQQFHSYTFLFLFKLVTLNHVLQFRKQYALSSLLKLVID